jgi:flagellar basal-body rod protein FlgB
MARDIEAVTLASIALAMDAAALRQQAIASNIANHATAGYVPLRLDFASQIREARESLQAQGRVDPAALLAVRLRLDPVFDASGRPAEVHIDAEMADMAQNSLQYQELARVLQRHFSILHSAATEGRH